MESNEMIYVVQNGELVPMQSEAKMSSPAKEEAKASTKVLKTLLAKDTSVLGAKTIEFRTSSEKLQKAAKGPGTRKSRAAMYVPITVKTLPKAATGVTAVIEKGSDGLEFAVFENPDNSQSTGGKRPASQDSHGSRKKRLKLFTPSKSISTDTKNKSVSCTNLSTKDTSLQGLGNRICRIKVEPPQQDEVMSFSYQENEERLLADIPVSSLCKSEPLEQQWENSQCDSFDDSGLFNSKSVVLTISDGLPHLISSDKGLVEGDQKLSGNEEESTRDSSYQCISKTYDSLRRLLFKCDNCGYSSKYKNAVKRHIEHCGRDNSCAKRSCIFPNCQVKFYHVSQMIRHMEVMHSASIGVKNLKFPSVEEFHEWKEKEEIANFTYFTKHRGDSRTKNGLYCIYICQNDGSNKSHRRKDQPPRLTKRRYKKGTIKTGATCPSRMFVTIHQKEVTVKYFYSHNHELKFENTQYHPIAQKSMDYIKSRFSVGASPKQVQEELCNKAIYREKKEGDEECVKGQMISLRTLKAIKFEYLSSFRLDKDDANSVFLLVKEWEKQDFNPVMLYKPQYSPVVIGGCSERYPSLSDNGIFFIGLQTEVQFALLNTSSSKLLCIDTTYCNGRQGFYMLSLIVHDECGKGMPVAHFITNCKSEEVLGYFFSTLKERCPNLLVHGVMTDTEFAGWEAFLNSFGYVSIHVICQWHVKRHWKKKVEVLVDNHMQREMIDELTAMLQEQDESNLGNLMTSFKLKYENTCPKFMEFFQTCIISQPEMWATCLRDLASCNSVTDMYCKPFHNTLEDFFSKTKSKKRIDDLMLLLLRIEDIDGEQQLQYKNPSCKSESAGKHSKSLDIVDADVTEVDGCWKVVSQKNRHRVYEVVKLREECREDFCFAECQDLPCVNLCSHLYKCSCGDASGLCEHIHKVHSGKCNVIIICSPEEQVVIGPEGNEVVLHSDPLSVTAVTKQEILLNSIYDKLGKLGSIVNQSSIQDFLPHIAGTLDQLLTKCQKRTQIHDNL